MKKSATKFIPANHRYNIGHRDAPRLVLVRHTRVQPGADDEDDEDDGDDGEDEERDGEGERSVGVI